MLRGTDQSTKVVTIHKSRDNTNVTVLRGTDQSYTTGTVPWLHAIRSAGLALCRDCTSFVTASHQLKAVVTCLARPEMTLGGWREVKTQSLTNLPACPWRLAAERRPWQGSPGWFCSSSLRNVSECPLILLSITSCLPDHTHFARITSDCSPNPRSFAQC